jgi:WXG100 family type VII secretion target
MALIKLTPEDLVISAKQYTEGASGIREILQKLTREQDTIRDNWDGQSFQKFDEQFMDLTPKVEEFAQLLDDINQQLNDVAKIIEDTDREIASKIGF